MNPDDQSRDFREEKQRIREAYDSRPESDLYSFFNPAQLFLVQERERQFLDLLRRAGTNRLDDTKILEIGCGDGLWIGEFIKWGARPEHLTGLDLRLDSLALAQSLHSEKVGFVCGNGAHLPFPPGTFDLVLQATAFTSILDRDMQQTVAQEMLRVLKPQGFIIWYDYHVNNPRNPDVRGVKKREITQTFFPGCAVKLRRLTLAPPLARLLAPLSPLLCALLERLPFLCTHYLGLIRKRV